MNEKLYKAIKRISTEGYCLLKCEDSNCLEYMVEEVCDILNGLQVAYTVFPLTDCVYPTSARMLIELDIEEQGGDDQ